MMLLLILGGLTVMGIFLGVLAARKLGTRISSPEKMERAKAVQRQSVHLKRDTLVVPGKEDDFMGGFGLDDRREDKR